MSDLASAPSGDLYQGIRDLLVAARACYAREADSQGWNVRALDQQINTMNISPVQA